VSRAPERRNVLLDRTVSPPAMLATNAMVAMA
jgi:hypothetical protein